MFILCLVLAVHAQAFPASEHRGHVLFGEVPVPGVVVRAMHGDTELRTITDLEGLYSFPDLAVGTWTVQLEMSGFAPMQRDLSVSTGAPSVTWQLQMLSLREMDAGDSPGVGRLSGDLVVPGNPEPLPEPLELDVSFPGASATRNRADQLPDEVILINGSIDDGQLREFGNERRHGLEAYTGDLAIAASNSALDARPYSLSGQDAAQPAYSRTDLLFSVSGPLRVPFRRREGPAFTIVYGRGQNHNLSLQAARVPTRAERVGDFSGHAAAPVDPATASPFPNGEIPEDRIASQARALLDLYPFPNSTAGKGYNYQVPTVSVSHRDDLQFQTGGAFADHRLSGSFAFQSTRSDSPNLFAFVDRLNTSSVNGSLGWSGLLTSNFSASAQYVFRRTATRTTPHFAYRLDVSGDAGISGNLQDDPRHWGPPKVNFSSGITGLFDGQHAFDRTQSSAISYGSTWIQDGHAWSFGAGFTREQVNVLSQQNARGTFTFTGAASGVDMADFLLGIPTASSIAFGNADKYFRQSIHSLYVMDDWKISPQFTLNLGVRWDYEAPVTERYGRLVNLDIAPGFEAVAPVLATRPHGELTGQLYPGSLVRPDKGGFQPRIGLAWRPSIDSSLVIRAGYGIYRDSGVYRSIAADMAQQSPLSTNLSVENTPSTPLTLANGFASSSPGSANTFAVDPNFRVGRAHNWQLSVQQDMPAALQVTGTYVGIKGTRLPQRSLPNTFPPGTGASCVRCSTGYVYLTSNGNSSQHSGTIALRRRQQNGFGANVQYTWSKAIDDAGLGTLHTAQDWQNLAGERALSNFDRRHQMLAQVFYTTGMMASLDTLRDGWIGHLIREWTLTTEWKVASGAPMTPVLIAPVPGTAVIGSLRPDRTDTPLYSVSEGTLVNSAAFSLPESGEWGNAGRNSIAGPNEFSLDASIGRTFRTSEGLVMDLRVDVTNVLNHVTFPDWDTTAGSSQFGLPSRADSMRTVRPTLRLSF